MKDTLTQFNFNSCWATSVLSAIQGNETDLHTNIIIFVKNSPSEVEQVKKNLLNWFVIEYNNSGEKSNVLCWKKNEQHFYYILGISFDLILK